MCDEIPGYMELHLSTSESTKNQFRFNQRLHLLRNQFFMKMGHYYVKKNFSRFYSMFLKYVQCRTILVSTKKSDLLLRSDSKIKCKMIYSWNPFNAVWSIAADLQARRFKGHSTHWKIARGKLSIKAFAAVLWVVMWRAPVIDQNSPISGCLAEVCN